MSDKHLVAEIKRLDAEVATLLERQIEQAIILVELSELVQRLVKDEAMKP